MKTIDELTAEVTALREAISFAAHRIETARMWNGTGWTYTTLHPTHYLPALDRLNAVMEDQRKQAAQDWLNPTERFA